MPAAVTIAQDHERSKLAYSLQRRASIDLVGLMNVASKCTKAGQDINFPLRFRTRHKCEQALLDGRKLSSAVQFSFDVVNEDEDEMFSLHCMFRADYELEEGYEPTPEEIGAFAESNAVFNCWPYFRELVQSTLARMNYPPLSIPFLRLVPKAAPPPQPKQAELIEAPQKMIEPIVPTSKRIRKRKGDK
jgi:hypothetical protein